MFLHGSVAHVLFNMWFLWIFGNNVEEAFGHLRYLFFYVAGGVAATAAFVALNPNSTAPLVGASGAIAAMLGAYAVLFPRHKVLSLLGWFILPVPAALFLGIWFVVQFGLGRDQCRMGGPCRWFPVWPRSRVGVQTEFDASATADLGRLVVCRMNGAVAIICKTHHYADCRCR